MCLAKTVEPIEMPAETWVPGGAQKTIHIHTTHTNLYSARNRENESEDLLTGGGAGFPRRLLLLLLLGPRQMCGRTV